MTQVAYQKHDDIVVLTLSNPPVNALGQTVRQGLLIAFERIKTDLQIRAVVIVGAGRTFIAGADIKEFGQPPQEPFLPDVCAAIEAAQVPVVASLHGVALGGGLEIALAAHFRIAQPATQVGFPEVGLGLIPGAGGTQRLPRLVGIEYALDMITTGRRMKASDALECGLVDRIADGDPTQNGIAFAQHLISTGAVAKPTSSLPPPQPVPWDVVEASIGAKFRGQDAPNKALAALRASTEHSFEQGLSLERAIFLELMEGPQRAALVHTFFAERAAGKLPAPHSNSAAEIADVGVVGVVGGGTMGVGIAAALLMAGFRTALIEVSAAAAGTARDRTEAILQGAVARGKMASDECARALDELFFVSESYKALAQADLVIEAVFENLQVKQDVFRALEQACKPTAILATNTSYLSVIEIASAVSDPGRVVGLHFFSPAHIMRLLEIVPHADTSDATTATAFQLAKRMKKIAVRAGDCEGFIGNRILRACRAEAERMVLCGASVAQVDRALTDFGFAMGPFEVSDLAGLDIAWNMRKNRAATHGGDLGGVGYTDLLCEAGQFGRKSGRGYYVYGKDVPPLTENPDAQGFIAQARQDQNVVPRGFTAPEIVSRYMAVMINEAAHILQEGAALRAGDIDVVLVHGYGFPKYKGGPCHWADRAGLSQVLSVVKNGFAEGTMDAPAAILRACVAEGRKFGSLDR